MKAISIRQPFAAMILGSDRSPGPKRVENRGRLWPGGDLNRWRPGVPGQDIEPAWFALHTGKQLFDFGGTKAENMDMQFAPWLKQLWPECPEWRSMDRGAIVGAIRVIGACTYDKANPHPDFDANPWANEGSTLWMIDAVVRLPQAIPYKGRQGLWVVEAEIVRALQDAREMYGIDDRHYPRPPGWDTYLQNQPDRWRRVVASRETK